MSPVVPPDPRHSPPVPAVLRLVRQSVLGRWEDSAAALYREVAELLETGPGQEVLVSGCGEGITAEWIAARTGAAVAGVDPDAERIERATARSRALPLHLSYEQAALDDLPHETAVFDAAVGEPVLAAAADPARAIAELARVVRPMGAVILLELTWNAEIPAGSRDMLVERLGLRPQQLVQWKRMMREAGLVDIQVQDWTARESVPGPPAAERDQGSRAASTARPGSRGATRCTSSGARGGAGAGARPGAPWRERKRCCASWRTRAYSDFDCSRE